MNTELIKSLELQGVKLKPPIFIGGEGRSGTRLLRNILGKHKNIFEIERETYIFATKNLKGVKYLDKLVKKKDYDLLILSILNSIYYKREVALLKSKNKNFESEHIKALDEIKQLQDYKNIKDKYDAFNLIANYLAVKSNKKRWVEKTPSNIYSVNEILALYPKAKFIVIHRDPRAVCASWLKKDKLKSLLGVCFSWNRASKQMEKLTYEMPHKFYMVRFEDLISYPERELRKLCEFLDEDFDPSMLNISVTNTHYENTKNKEGFSEETINRWSQMLTPSQKALVDMFTNHYRKKLHYANTEVKISFFTLVLTMLKEYFIFFIRKIILLKKTLL